jgi:hypothetical protein
LIRKEQERQSELEYIPAELAKGEESGLSDKSPRQIIKETKERLKKGWKTINSL